MKKLLLSLLLPAFFAGTSCSKSEEPAPDFSCDKNTHISSQLLGDIPVRIEYDDRGRISKVFRSDAQGLVENYQYDTDTTLTVTRHFSDGGIANTFRAELNAKGYVTSYETVGASSGYLILYRYDREGYLAEINARFKNPAQTMRSVYSYQDGNLREARLYTNDKLTYTETYTYLDDTNKANLVFNQNQPDLYGRISRNLVKSMIRTYTDGKEERVEFKYDLNSFGFVKSLTQTSADTEGNTSSQVNVYEYICL